MKSFLFLTTISAVILHFNAFNFDASLKNKSSVTKENYNRINEDKKCLDCHSGLIQKKQVHYPASESCEDCHLKNEGMHPNDGVKGFKLAKEGDKLCYMCHDNVNTQKYIHYPIEDGNCIDCHSPHSSNNSFLLNDAPTSIICFTCHDKEINDKSKAHAPYNQGDCSACHDPHQSNFKAFLKKDATELCLSCHKNIQEEMKKENIHPPAEDCLNCHKAHLSDYNSLLTNSFPRGLYSSSEIENFALCFDCHDSDLLKEDAINSTEFRNDEQNLHYLHIKGVKGRNCTSCHDMHGSTNRHLILNKLMFGKWEMQMKYKTTENGGSCAPGCHGETIYVR